MAEENITYYVGMQPYLTSQSSQGEVRYFPHQVRSFSNKYRKYVTVGNFPIHLNYSTNINRDFAELIESGPLELLIHQSYDVYTIPGANGAQQYGGIGNSIYLLRKAGEFAPFAAFSMTGKSDKQLRESLSRCLSSRPDLLEKLMKKSISYEDIPACIHAYNTGQPFK
ncbi:hypothetical protein [Hymenobacter wooponensis]|uniref:Uncharacterized protein n=1 Tax=Hymenobacter wooponensis TaxID=1525360 RepID=A0A4Z0MKK2_9BACT|nr:hypothetical protein [Hymenobacter wooponensis]TGD79910.1 hypothetical protein EU557_17010 [Hymenobacter wooponensis]